MNKAITIVESEKAIKEWKLCSGKMELNFSFNVNNVEDMNDFVGLLKEALKITQEKIKELPKKA